MTKEVETFDPYDPNGMNASPVESSLCSLEGMLLRLSNEVKDGGNRYQMMLCMALRGCGAYARDVREECSAKMDENKTNP